jgi:hypothetical protein
MLKRNIDQEYSRSYNHEVKSATWMRPGKECCQPIAYTVTAVTLKKIAPTSPPPKNTYHNLTRGLMGLRLSHFFFKYEGVMLPSRKYMLNFKARSIFGYNFC